MSLGRNVFDVLLSSSVFLFENKLLVMDADSVWSICAKEKFWKKKLILRSVFFFNCWRWMLRVYINWENFASFFFEQSFKVDANIWADTLDTVNI